MVREKSHFGYFAIKKDPKFEYKGFWQSTDVNKLREWVTREKSPDKKENSAIEGSEGRNVESQGKIDFGGLMKKAISSSLSQDHLISTAFTAIMLFSRIVSTNEIVEPAKASGEIIEEDEEYVIFGLSEERFIKP